MSFINKLIPTKKVIIIDIGTYKVKVALCEYKNNEINLISYKEKKQDSQNIIGTEISSIEGILNTIEDVFSNVLNNLDISVKDIILNIPTSTIISSGKDINYKRINDKESIDIKELDYIVSKVENEALIKAKESIFKKTGYLDVDMKLITSSITDINIDGFIVSNPIGFTGKDVFISVLNIFIPANRYNIITTIGNHLNKNILSIIPLEFSLPKILSNTDYQYDDVLFIDIGNSKTSLIVQKSGVIIGFDKINLGISDLIKNIKNSSGDTTIEIIKNIDKKDTYLKEKKEFLEVFEEGFILSLKEILKSSLVPHKVFISGGGDNEFVRAFIKNINLTKYTLHSLKPLDFIKIDFNEIKINGDKSIFNKTNLGILSMMIATKEIISYKNNPLISLVKSFIEKNEL
ncbi:hypothetical protein H3C61_02185 [Candidatus Gracilibacteria bacterium]|nr:hypothetical protein [Candidatus Gracilibacteria bacterium]